MKSTYYFQRYPRSAAIKARELIKEQCINKPSKSITEEESKKIIAFVSDMINNVSNTDCFKERANYINQIYQMMLKYPAFLVNYPSYRNVSYNKIQELERIIEKDIEQYANSTIALTMDKLISLVKTTINHPLVSTPILESLNEVKKMMKDYEVAIARTELVSTLKKARILYASITA